MTGIVKRLAKLSPAKRRTLAQQLAKEQGLDSQEPIDPQPRDRGPLPLSFSQERLWFLNQLEPESDAYNLYYALRLEGELAVPALQGSFREVVRRHESLRTTFVAGDGKPVQVIHAPPAFTLPVLALESLPQAARQAEVKRLTAAAAARPFDPARSPLLQVLLLRLAPAEHVLLLTIHHIISDGWSLGVLIREVTTIYHAFLHGRPSPLPELEIQFADYAVWQRRWLEGAVLESLLGYWRRQLAGAPPLVELPTDRPRSLRRGTRGSTRLVRLAPSLNAGCKALSSEQGCTPFVTLLAAFAVLLGRYSGQSEVVVGSPIANRRRTEVESLIGFVLNTLVLRLDLSGDRASRDPVFTEFLGRTRELVLEAFAHQDLPFSRLVDELPRSSSRADPESSDSRVSRSSTAAARLPRTGLAWPPHTSANRCPRRASTSSRTIRIRSASWTPVGSRSTIDNACSSSDDACFASAGVEKSRAAARAASSSAAGSSAAVPPGPVQRPASSASAELSAAPAAGARAARAPRTRRITSSED
ncbi:MAG: hypothetical protein GY856_44415, partial [bacterium]|nr:hypothetical protein [bacterium]